MMSLDVVVGAQFGSEAKGHVTQRLAERRLQEGHNGLTVVRVAGPNAGHTGHDRLGTPWALRQIPVAAVVDNPRTYLELEIASGSEIDPDVLLDEYDRLNHAGLLENKSLVVSPEATVITDSHKKIESIEGLTTRIGSTGKGIGAARSDRIMRTALRVKDCPDLIEQLERRGIVVLGTPIRYPATIIEGTQGFGLGLHAGFYPQCTSSDCRAIDFMAMAGVHPWEYDITNVWCVARVFPIRVAGNSGPLRDETSWGELGLPEERTTVTKKIRRVGLPDWDLVAAAVGANGGAPTVQLAVTMLDQMFPAMANKEYLNAGARLYLQEVEKATGARVSLATTGPDTAIWIDR